MEKQGIRALVGGVILDIWIGCFFIWGNIAVYVLSYFKSQGVEVAYESVLQIDSILIFSNLSGYPLGLFLLSKRIDPRLIITMGASLSLSGIVLSSFVQSWPLFCLTYGLMNGLGAGTCYMVPLMVAWEYFPERRGLVTGIIDGAYGLGSFSYTLLSRQIVNPENEPASVKEASISFFPPEIAARTPSLLRTLALCWLVHILIAICLIKRRPQSDKKEEEEEDSVRIEEKKGVGSFTQGLFSWSFLSLYLIMYLGNYFGTFFSYTFKIYGLHNDLSDDLLTWAGASASVANGFSRVGFGYLVDVIGFKQVATILFSMLLLVSLTCTDCVHSGFLYFMSLVINIAAMGSFFAILPPATLKCFGMEYGPYLYTIITTATLLTALTNILNASLIEVIGMRGVCLIGSFSIFLAYFVLFRFV